MLKWHLLYISNERAKSEQCKKTNINTGAHKSQAIAQNKHWIISDLLNTFYDLVVKHCSFTERKRLSLCLFLWCNHEPKSSRDPSLLSFSFCLYQTQIHRETGTAGFNVHLSYQSMSQWNLTVPTTETLDAQFPRLWVLQCFNNIHQKS